MFATRQFFITLLLVFVAFQTVAALPTRRSFNNNNNKRTTAAATKRAVNNNKPTVDAEKRASYIATYLSQLRKRESGIFTASTAFET